MISPKNRLSHARFPPVTGRQEQVSGELRPQLKPKYLSSEILQVKDQARFFSVIATHKMHKQDQGQQKSDQVHHANVFLSESFCRVGDCKIDWERKTPDEEGTDCGRPFDEQGFEDQSTLWICFVISHKLEQTPQTREVLPQSLGNRHPLPWLHPYGSGHTTTGDSAKSGYTNLSCKVPRCQCSDWSSKGFDCPMILRQWNSDPQKL